MADTPIGPGFPNPFGFDLEQLMRMLQSQGPVNLEIARQVATAVATADPETGESTNEPPIDATARATFESVVRAAQVTVAETTGIAATLGVPTTCVNRAEWANATIDGLLPVLTSLAGALQRGDGDEGAVATAMPGSEFETPEMGGDIGAFLMQSLLPLLLGVWAGSMIGQLSHHALGQYDLPLPLHGTPAQRFLVRNVEAFGEEWALPADELRYALGVAGGRARRAAIGSLGSRRARAARVRLRRRVRSAARRAPGAAR